MHTSATHVRWSTPATLPLHPSKKQCHPMIKRRLSHPLPARPPCCPPGPDGSPAIPHNTRVKIRLQSWQDWWVDRVPAWIKYATIPEGEMGAKYNGVYWDPPRGERHIW